MPYKALEMWQGHRQTIFLALESIRAGNAGIPLAVAAIQNGLIDSENAAAPELLSSGQTCLKSSTAAIAIGIEELESSIKALAPLLDGIQEALVGTGAANAIEPPTPPPAHPTLGKCNCG